MTAVPPRSPAADAANPPGLPLAAAAASARNDVRPHTVSWSFPGVPDDVAATARSAWGVTVTDDRTATDPRSLPAFAALLAQARSEQIVRALARRTNLVLPAASALVIGDGALSDAIAATLERGGSRVRRGILDPIPRLRAHLAGARTVSPPWADADLVIATGEAHPPLGTSDVTGVVIDASLGSIGVLPPLDAEPVRPFVHRVATRTWVVDAPDIYESGGSTGASRIADLLIALSILRTQEADADGPGFSDAVADRRLAELVIR